MKIIKIAMLVTLMLLLMLKLIVSCSSEITVTETTTTYSTVKNDSLGIDATVEGATEEITDPPDEELRFFDDLIVALRNATFGEDSMPNITEEDIVKRIDGEKNIALFIKGKTPKKSLDEISLVMVRKKLEGDKILYSEAFSKTSLTWYICKIYSKKRQTTIEEMLGFHFFNDAMGKQILDDKGGSFYWGLTNNKSIFNLTVKGVAPTEIIEYEMDGATVYLWYFTHLDIDYKNLDKSEIKISKNFQ